MLETEIKTGSVMQNAFVLLFLALSGLSIYAANLRLRWFMVWLILVVILVLMKKVFLDRPIHLSTNSLDDAKADWQLVYMRRQRPVVWVGQMKKVNQFSQCIQLTMLTTYPEVREKSFVLWRDQVSAENWRRLTVFARFR